MAEQYPAGSEQDSLEEGAGQEEEPRYTDVDLFLVGKTGHGRSQTGNAILGRDVFEASDSVDSATYDIQMICARRLRRKIKVVDGPGLGDTRMDKGKAAQKAVEDMTKALMHCPEGFHALILVLKYGQRLTEEELMVIDGLKRIFGQDFVREYCILLFTHGDNFHAKNKKRKPPITFEDWCKEQRDPAKKIFEECNWRIVLFDNMNEDKYDEQLRKLLTLVDHLKARGKRYTNQIFEQVAKGREKYIIEEKMPMLRESIQTNIDLLTQGLDKVKDCTELNDDIQRLFDQLFEDAKKLEIEIGIHDNGTGVLDGLRENVKTLENAIKSKRDFLLEKKNSEKSKEELERMDAEHKKKIDALQDEMTNFREDSKNREKQMVDHMQLMTKVGTLVDVKDLIMRDLAMESIRQRERESQNSCLLM